jgi:single-stranded-DNA-specific exonuclease
MYKVHKLAKSLYIFYSTSMNVLISKKQNSIPQTTFDLQSLLLKNRDLTTQKLQHTFFHPTHPKDLTPSDVGIDPQQLQSAISLIKQAKESQDLVIVYGDYDADGITATTILWETLYEIGVNALPFIPERMDGYGLTDASIEKLLAQHQPKLLITVDNGIVAHEQIKQLKKQGIQVIISDHHQLDGALPEADAVVHTTHLCGATTAWMIARELHKEKALSMLDLCAIATIADQVPLRDANRSFAKFGLEALRTTRRPSLNMLFELANIKKEKITEHTINFGIAPRINAVGRLDSAMDALRMMCAKTPGSAKKYAEKIHVKNIERQEKTQTALDDAIEQAKKQTDKKIIVVASENYHEGIIGLVAGRLCELFYKPAIAIAIHDGTAKGSGRSVSGVNIVEMVRQVRDDLIDVGGHPMACGFSMESEKIEEMTEHVQKIAESIDDALLVPKFEVECVLPLPLVSVETADMIQTFAPFGQTNPEPVFLFEDVKVEDKQTYGKTYTITKFLLSQGGGKNIVEAITFDPRINENSFEKGVIGSVQVNEFRGERKAQVKIKSRG